MAPVRHLIVNADDFGQSQGVNRGIIEAHEHGIVTSASLMVRWPAAKAAADYCRAHPSLSVGIHFDLSEWAYRNKQWVPLYKVVPLEDPAAVSQELSRQMELFRRLIGQDPTHIDSHQHVHLKEPVRSFVEEISRKLGVPVRRLDSHVSYCGDFYGQTAEGFPLPGALNVDRLIKILSSLPLGVTELGCHPGRSDDLDTMYRSERAEEVKTLRDPRVRQAILQMGIKLCSFSDVTGCYRQSRNV